MTQQQLDLFNDILNNNETDKDENDNENNLCLITNSVLKDNFITLDCGHRFNIEPLYHEVVWQKTKKYLDNAKLKLNEIKCPYCRSITNKLLPNHKYYDVKQISGVNFPPHLCMKIYSCEFLLKTGFPCNNSACLTKNGVLCNKHTKYSIVTEGILESKTSIEKIDYYKKKTVIELKRILTKNKCKKSGNKKELIDNILIGQHKNPLKWQENE